jgi:hypothetical protein
MPLPAPFPFIIAWLLIGAGLFLAFEAVLGPRLRSLGVAGLSRVFPPGRLGGVAEAIAAGAVLAIAFVLIAIGGVMLRGAIPW